MSKDEARKALQRAQSQLDRVRVASFDPPDHIAAVTFGFYAYENAIVAIAEAKGMKWKKNHYDKAKLAETLFKRKIVSVDIGERLLSLNDLRKNVAYDSPGPELQEIDLEDLATDLEAFVEEVQDIVEAQES